MNACLIALSAVLALFGGGKIDWGKLPIDEALKSATKSDKHTLAYFCADWSGLCAQLDAGPFSDDEVVRASEGFVRVMVDCTDKKVSEQMGTDYAVREIPTVIVFDSKGKQVIQITGYKTADVFVRNLAPFVAVVASAPLAPITDEFKETDRIHLHSGTFIDCQIKERGEYDLVIQWDANITVKIKRIDIAKIEKITIRSLGSKIKTEEVRPKPAEVKPEVKPEGDPEVKPEVKPETPPEKVMSPDEKKLAEAVGRIPQVIKDGILKSMAQLLRSTDEGERQKIVVGMSDIKSESEIYLTYLSRDKGSWENRQQAAHALGELRILSAVPGLIELLPKEKDWPAQSEQCLALGKLGDARAELPLIKMLKSRNHVIVDSAQKALKNLTNQPLMSGGYDEWYEWYRAKYNK